jgi:predicted nucleic acid-binding protein
MNTKSSNFLLDSDIIIDFLKGDTLITGFMVKIKEESNLFYSPLSKAEIYSGAFQNEYEKISLFFDKLQSIDITDPIGEKAGILLNKYRKSHNIGIVDSLIAATAIYYNLKLITRNIKHYPMPEVIIINPQVLP